MNAITKGGYQDVPMSRRRAQLLAEYAERLATMLENAPDDKDLAEWVQSKIDRAASSIQSAYHYLDQEDDLEKARSKLYDYRRPSKRINKKTGRREWDYFYTKKHGGRVSSGAFEQGAAFRLTFKGRKGHFHIDHVEGDMIHITHDAHPDKKLKPIHRDELRALLKRQNRREETKHLARKKRVVDKLKRNPTRKRSSLGLALHRLRQAADKAGVTLPEEYQRKPKKTRVKRPKTAVQGQDNFDTMPEVESTGTPNRNLNPHRQGWRVNFNPDAEYYERSKSTILRAIGLTIEGARKHTHKEARLAHEAQYNSHVQALIKLKRKALKDGFDISYTIPPYPEELKYTETPREDRFDTMPEVESTGTARDQLTSTAQEIITEADQDHDERHDEHQSIEQFELGEHTHTKTGVKLFTAKQKGRTDRDEYRRRVEIAKKHDGRYERRYVKGFLFKTAEDARNFALEVEGGQVEESAETVTPHEDHPQADNFDTMPEVESTGTPDQRLRGVLDALAESERLNTINPKNRRRPKEAKAADKRLIELVNEIAEDQDPEQKRFLKVMTAMLQGVEKKRNAYDRQESRKDRYATIREFIEKELGIEPTVTAPNLSEILSQPTTSNTRPANSPEITDQEKVPTTSNTRPANVYGRATKKMVDQALSSEPTGFDPNRIGADLPTKGDLREMLSQEKRLERAKEDLRSVGAPNLAGKRNPRFDIMYALGGYLKGPYTTLQHERLRHFERGLKIALRDSKGEELEQVKDETARFWREWGGEYKRLHSELVTESTQGEALRNIRPLIPERALTPEINQLLDQMERELDQKTVPTREVSERIDTEETNQATRDRQPTPTTAREQLTETAREVESVEIPTSLKKKAEKLNRYLGISGEITKEEAEDWKVVERERESLVFRRDSRMPPINSIMEGRRPSRLSPEIQDRFKRLENLMLELEQMEEKRTKTGRLKNWQGIKAKREEALKARRDLLRLQSDRTDRELGAIQDASYLSYYSPKRSTATSSEVGDKQGDRRSDLQTLRRYFETYEPSANQEQAQRAQKSALHLTNYRADLYRTIERLAS